MSKGTKWWVLMLNDMRYPKIQMHHEVARGESKEALVDWVNSQRAPEVYSDEDGGRSWGKHFKKGSPLEWYNPPEGTEGFFAAFQYAGSYNEFVDDAIKQADELWTKLESIPDIGTMSNG